MIISRNYRRNQEGIKDAPIKVTLKTRTMTFNLRTTYRDGTVVDGYRSRRGSK